VRPDGEGTHPPLDHPGYRSTKLRAPSRPLVAITQSLTELTAPVFGDGRVRATDADLTRQHDGEPQGERIIVYGQVLEEDRRPVPDTLVEIWQANAAGRYNSPLDQQEDKPIDESFRGWGRTGTDFKTGVYTFETIKPGRVVGRTGHRPSAPHINLWLAARGINIGLATRLYFADETQANADDPVLNMIEPAVRRETLLAQRGERDGAVVYTFDIRLQGERETVFFDV